MIMNVKEQLKLKLEKFKSEKIELRYKKESHFQKQITRYKEHMAWTNKYNTDNTLKEIEGGKT